MMIFGPKIMFKDYDSDYKIGDIIKIKNSKNECYALVYDVGYSLFKLSDFIKISFIDFVGINSWRYVPMLKKKKIYLDKYQPIVILKISEIDKIKV